MLGDIDAVANIAVENLETARKFYEGTLGLTQVAAEGQEVIVFKSGNSTLNVYRSQYAGTNLKDKGITFEHYDMPGMTRDGDVHVAGHMRVAWLKDPDGNILNVVSG